MRVWIHMLGTEKQRKRKPLSETILIWRDIFLMVNYSKDKIWLPPITYYDPKGNKRVELRELGHVISNGKLSSDSELAYVFHNSRKENGLAFDYSKDLISQVKSLVTKGIVKERYQDVLDFYKNQADYSPDDVFTFDDMDLETAMSKYDAAKKEQKPINII